jgi:hypothetical protein
MLSACWWRWTAQTAAKATSDTRELAVDYRIRSRSHFANIKAFAASPDDARSPMGTCPLMMSTV